MSDVWFESSIRDMLVEEFSGEWGGEPTGEFGNAKVLRSTNLDDDGHVDLGGGAERVIPRLKLGRKHLKNGDLLLEASGGGPGKPVGRVALFEAADEREYLCSNFFRTLRPGDSVEPRFLLWRLLYLYSQPQIWSFQQQTTGIINLKTAEYLDQVLSWPPLPEQRRIAEVLDTADEAIRQTEALIAKLQQMKQGLLHDLLTRGLDENGELRDPVAHPEQFKDSPLGRIPRGWEIAPLGELLSVIYRYPSYYGIEYEVEGVPEVRGELIQNDGTVETDPAKYRFVSEATADRFRRVRLDAGDIVMSVRGTLGKFARVPSHLTGAVITANLIRLQFNSEVDSAWAVHLLLAPHFQAELDAASSATTIKTIQASELSAILVAVPPLAEQRVIAALCEQSDARIRAEEAYRDKLRLLKQGLMQDLLTGRVRVPLPEGEPEMLASAV